MLKAQYTIAEDESDRGIVDTEAVKSTVAQKRKQDDIDDSDDDSSHEDINEVNDDSQSPKRLKGVVEDEVDLLDADNAMITET